MVYTSKDVRLWDGYEKYNYFIRYLRYKRNQMSEKFLGHEYWPFPTYEAGKKLLSYEETNALIGERLLGQTPFWVGRFGGTEMNMIYEVLKHRIHPDYNNNKEAIDRLCTYSGFFPNDIELGEQFVDMMLECCKEIDLQAAWGRYMADYVYKMYQPNTVLTGLLKIEPWYMYKTKSRVKPWSHALAGKRVLVVHPFVESIVEQYKNNREHIFENIFRADDILPEFELQTLKAVQTLAGETDPRFSSWFEALDWMTEECASRDFDVAIVGCGAYGYPLAARIKKMGKHVVHLAGATQLLFGVKGKRWETFYMYKDFKETVINDYWISPNSNESIKNKSTVEDSCYW